MTRAFRSIAGAGVGVVNVASVGVADIVGLSVAWAGVELISACFCGLLHPAISRAKTTSNASKRQHILVGIKWGYHVRRQSYFDKCNSSLRYWMTSLNYGTFSGTVLIKASWASNTGPERCGLLLAVLEELARPFLRRSRVRWKAGPTPSYTLIPRFARWD